MENVFIKNPNVIKKVKLDRTVLNKMDAAYLEILKIDENLEQEACKVKKDIEDIKSNIAALEKEKLDLQTLIAKGNAGLSQKLLEGTQNIVKLKKELDFKTANLEEFNNLLETNLKTLVEKLFNEFIDSRELIQEFNKNVDNMCLKLYSHLYQAFEVVQEMQQLDKEYTKKCVEVFNYNGIKKDFTFAFNTNVPIGFVERNFPYNNQHQNYYNTQDMYKYLDALEKAPKNKNLELYK